MTIPCPTCQTAATVALDALELVRKLESSNARLTALLRESEAVFSEAKRIILEQAAIIRFLLLTLAWRK